MKYRRDRKVFSYCCWQKEYLFGILTAREHMNSNCFFQKN